MTAAGPRPPLPPDDPDAEAPARVAGQVEAIAGAVARLRGVEQAPGG